MCVHLSEFPTPRSDPTSSSSTVYNTNNGGTSSCSTRHQSDCGVTSPATNGRGPTPVLRNDDFLTPSSDVQREGVSPNISIAASLSLRGSTADPCRKSTITSTISPRDKTADTDKMSSLNGSLNAMTLEKNAELRITKLIAIKHMLDLIQPLFYALRETSSGLLKTYRDVSSPLGAVFAEV